MKIIRHQTPAGTVWAALQPDGTARVIAGDILGKYRVTDEVVRPGRVLAPLLPANILCIGLNYRKHAAESKSEPPVHPVLFIKNTASLQNPGDPIEIPVKLASTRVDYECELAVVIGRRCKNATRANALDFVLGYTCANDVSARDWQRDGGGGQWCQGKSFDTFCPLGPVLVTKDEIPNPNDLRIKTVLNGETMQDWTTSDMIFDVPSLIEFLSGSKTLLPGTVILTGTPHGVGFARKPPVWLKAGDTVSVEIEKIGALTNPVINEPA
ncbi:MAG TPA: fumarylacetoacetate hydrolase family protein [Lacunisphaera sp.]|nr:fumarylacetoacetate hydrolase family protein [Lacunisphaera sp.]